MSDKRDVPFLLKAFSLSQNTAKFDLISFCLFVQKYATKYSDNYPELKPYENIGTEDMSEQLEQLKDAGEIEYIVHINGNGTITVPHYYIEKIKRIFNSITEKPTVAFPTQQDLPKDIPQNFVKKIELDETFTQLTGSNKTTEILYQLNFGPVLPFLIFPSSMSAESLLLLSLVKLKTYLEKDETADYAYKRLLAANSGKNFTVKNFLTDIQNHPHQAMETIKEASETYLLWGQLCTFIIQEFDKKSEKLAEEISILQGVRIIEFMSTYYRTKNQKKLQSETALKNLGLCLQQSPYHFTLKAITNFKDSRGVPLLGQYEKDELQNYINKRTSEINEYSIPDLLIFKNQGGETFFVLTSKVIPLIIYFINQYRKRIQDQCIKNWKNDLKNFTNNPAMKDDKAFDQYLQNLVQANANNLYSLLTSKFITSVSNDKKILETQPIEYSRIFPQGHLAPYSQLLLLDRNETVRDTKILLPFWYSISLFYKIASFFHRKKTKTSNANNAAANNSKGEKIPKLTMKDKAKELLPEFLPENMSYEDAMQKYLYNWNQNLSEEYRNNLTEDVNSLIRDYIRGVQRTLSVKSLTKEHISALANRIVKTPSLLTISDKDSLQKYCELYILDLIQKFF